MTLDEIRGEVQAGRTSPALVRELLDIATRQQGIIDHATDILDGWHAPETQNGTALSIGGRVHYFAILLYHGIDTIKAENARLTATNRRLLAELERWQDRVGLLRIDAQPGEPVKAALRSARRTADGE